MLKAATVLPISRPEDLDGAPAAWDISPGGVHRDSDVRARCNHDVAVRELTKVDPDGRDHRVLRFGHWGVGWIDEILVRRDTRAHDIACQLARSLENHPILDEVALAKAEQEAHEEGTCDADCSFCEDEDEDEGEDEDEDEDDEHVSEDDTGPCDCPECHPEPDPDDSDSEVKVTRLGPSSGDCPVGDCPRRAYPWQVGAVTDGYIDACTLHVQQAARDFLGTRKDDE